MARARIQTSTPPLLASEGFPEWHQLPLRYREQYTPPGNRGISLKLAPQATCACGRDVASVTVKIGPLLEAVSGEPLGTPSLLGYTPAPFGLTSLSLSASAPQLGVVYTEGGFVEGINKQLGLFGDYVDIFKGIPFATPTKALENPQPHPGWEGRWVWAGAGQASRLGVPKGGRHPHASPSGCPQGL